MITILHLSIRLVNHIKAPNKVHMPVLGRWDDDADDFQAQPVVQKRAGVWRYEDESSEGNPNASSGSEYLG